MGDQEVIVLLHIAEANGLYNRNEPVAISASLGGITLESDAHQPGQTTIFDINLVWETDKRVIKRMKTENLPIKLECYSGSHPATATTAQRRQLIGFVMIPIRGVPIIHGQQQAAKCVPRWHKLMGLTPDWKALKPEISMYSCITNPAQADAVKSQQRDTKSVESIATSNMLCPQLGLYVRLLPEQHCIQLGDAPDDSTLFGVHIELRALRGVRLRDRKTTTTNNQLHIQYILFGAPSEDRLLVPSPDGQLFAIEEKINIQLRGSLRSVAEYFGRIFYIPIEVYCNSSVIGFVRFAVNIPAVQPPPPNGRKARGRVYQVFDRCFFASETAAEDGDDSARRRPWIEYELVLSLLNPPPPLSESEDEAVSVAPMSIDLGAAGDCFPQSAGKPSPESAEAPSRQSQRLDCIDEVPPSDSGESKSTQPAAAPDPAAAPAATTPKTFSYQLTLEQVRFTRKCEPGIWQLSLHHPKAHTPIAMCNVSVRETSQLSANAPLFVDCRIELLFSVPEAGIRALIESEPSVLNIKGPHAMFATAELDNAALLAQAERTAGIVLMENEAREKMAIAHAFVELRDLGANLNAQQPKFRRFAQQTAATGGGVAAAAAAGGCQLRPLLDEELAYKMVEELEDWKTRQQDAFLVELKRREIQHLARLTTEWQLRRAELEQMLSTKLDQCGQLTVALEVANKNVRDKQLEDMDRQRLFAQAKGDLEQACTKKLLHLQEQARRTEADAAYEAKLAQLRYGELQLRNDQLRLENRQLHTVMAEMGAELERGSGDQWEAREERRRTEDKAERSSSDIVSKVADKEAESDDTSAGIGSGAISLTDLIVSEKAELLAEQAELLAITETLELEKWQNR